MRTWEVRAREADQAVFVDFEDGRFTFAVYRGDELVTGAGAGAEPDEPIIDPGHLIERSRRWVDWNRYENVELGRQMWRDWRDDFDAATASALSAMAIL